MMQWLRSLAFLTFSFVAAVLYAALILLLFWASPSIRWKVCVNYCRLTLWAGDFFCGMKVIVEGRGNIPAEASVIMIKHTTSLETYGHLAMFPRTAWVLKRSILYVPIVGWAIALMFNPIAINRSDGRRSVRQVVRQGKQRLAEGTWVTIFPEGTRVGPGETRKYGISGAALAAEAGVLVVPVAHNAGDFWRRREFTKRPGTVRFCIGPPISAATQSPKETNLIAQEWIENKMHEISKEYRDKG